MNKNELSNQEDRIPNKEVTMGLTIILILIISSTITGCSKKPEAPPIQTLLDSFTKAVANRDTENLTSLFVAPDETPEGKNRQSKIDGMTRDWFDEASPKVTVSFTNVKFDNESRLEVDMVLINASGGFQLRPAKFKVCLTNSEWKIVDMDM